MLFKSFQQLFAHVYLAHNLDVQDPENLQSIASYYGWKMIDHQEKISMISFRKGDWRINIYYSTMTIATCLKHPKRGSTQLFRRGMYNQKQIEKIFENPRMHTNKGYYNK